MKRQLLFALLLAVLPFGLQAAMTGPSLKIPYGGTLRGHFTSEHYYKQLDKPVRMEGRFVVAPAHGIICQVEKPVPLTFVVTPSGLTQGLGDMPLMQIKSRNMPFLEQATGQLTQALAGDWRALENDFTVTSKPSEKGWRVSFAPRANRSAPFRSLSAEGDQFVETAKVIRRDGGKENYTFSDQSISPAPPTPAELAAFAKLAP